VYIFLLLAEDNPLTSVIFLDGDSAKTCCQRKNVPPECNFLCESSHGSVGFVTKWKCRAKYYATIKTCEVGDTFGKMTIYKL
jgi:hypothetical protein